MIAVSRSLSEYTGFPSSPRNSKHHRIPDQVRRLLDHLSLAGESADFVLVAAEGEPRDGTDSRIPSLLMRPPAQLDEVLEIECLAHAGSPIRRRWLSTFVP